MRLTVSKADAGRQLTLSEGDVLASILMKQGEPVGRLREIELRNQHMTYAITW